MIDRLPISAVHIQFEYERSKVENCVTSGDPTQNTHISFHVSIETKRHGGKVTLSLTAQIPASKQMIGKQFKPRMNECIAKVIYASNRNDESESH